jgi:hypothetical protein
MYEKTKYVKSGIRGGKDKKKFANHIPIDIPLAIIHIKL